MNTSVTRKIGSGVYKSLMDVVVNRYNFKIAADNNPYVSGRFVRDGCTVTFYTSGKVLLQGDESTVNAVCEALFGNTSVTAVKSAKVGANVPVSTPHIGADEVGKGDYFGPLVVCACYVPMGSFEILKQEGVGDSKTKSDKNIGKIYGRIKDKVRFRVSVMEPEEYNSQYPKFGNVAKMLAKLHMDNVRNLIGELEYEGITYNKVVIDQFSADKSRIASLSDGLKVEQMHHAESQDITVAAASIIARQHFLDHMEKMNNEYGFAFPKGATHVLIPAREFVLKYGKSELTRVAKTSFKTTLQI